jgi:hypothetical protein
MKFARISAIVLLAFLGLSGIAGGAPMIVSSIWKTRGFMPLSLLQHSPFHSYLIPGIILLVANGLLALWILRIVIQQGPAMGCGQRCRGAC